MGSQQNGILGQQKSKRPQKRNSPAGICTMATYIFWHCHAESGSFSAFHTQHTRHNSFIIKRLLVTHILGQATARNKSIAIRQGPSNLSGG